jgi:choline-sulfatase
MTPQNLLIIMDDEHNKKVLGYNGHPMVKTPNLDRLASRGTIFSNAYTNSPICVPARAAFATGRYVHQNRCWDNAIAYSGNPISWAHVLRDRGHQVVSIGKLHYSNDEIDGGFSDQIIPMHIEAGVGDLYGLIRNPLPIRHQSADLARSIGPGESSYTQYDRDIASKTVNWLKAVANAKTNKPWVLFASFMAPHSPLIAPEEFYSMYPTNAIELPIKKVAYHPWIKAWNDCYRFDSYFESDEQRRIAIASYFGLCTFLDANVGRILQALEETGLKQQTRVVFVSDHGDNLGSRSLWGKSTMYEESAGIPMIAAGAEISAGKQIQTPVSHVDFFPSILSAVGVPVSEFQDLPGESFFDLMNRPYDSQRTVFSEYHAAGSVSAAYMLRKGKYKYIYYSGFAPELFDLDTDPEEINDLAADPNMHDVLAEFSASLHAICDPQAMDQLAKQDQLALIQANGGEQKILARGGSSYTPIPGEEVKLLSQTI